MVKDERIYSSKEFDYPADFLDSSRINSGVDDQYQNDRMTRTAKLATVNEKEETENNISHIKPSKKSKKKKVEDPNDKVAHAKKVAKFLLVHIGIFLLVITYAVAGAFLFQLLEQHQEIQNCQFAQGKTQETVKDYRSKFVNYILFNITTNPYLDNSTGKDEPKVYNPKISSMLKDMRDEFLSYNSKYKYSGQDCEKQSLWVFSSAFLFAMTVVTTIGYGHISPTTWEGQIVCICYATVGIPLFLMGVANISSILSDLSRFLYGSLISLFSCCSKKNKQEEEMDESEEKSKSDESEEKEKTIEGIICNKTDKSKLSSSKQNLSDDKNESIEAIGNVDDDNEEGDEDENKVSVPLFLVFIIFGSYLYIGSVVFTKIETWTDVQGAYFSYVSLSTMGFGDLVPGLASITSGNFSKGSTNLIIATFYIVIGMSLLAMCFELIQDQIVNKVKHISQLLGIHSEEEENNNNDEDKADDVIDENANKEKKEMPKSALTMYDENLEVQEIENNNYMSYQASTSASSNKSNMIKTETEYPKTTKLWVKSAISIKKERKGSESKC